MYFGTIKYYGTITLFQKSEVCGLGDKIRTAKRNRVHTYDAIGSFGSGTEVVRTDFLHYVTADSVETTRECAPDFGPLVSQAERSGPFESLKLRCVGDTGAVDGKLCARIELSRD